MQFEGQWPEHERRSYANGVPPRKNFENTGLKEGIWEPPDVIWHYCYALKVLSWKQLKNTHTQQKQIKVKEESFNSCLQL